MGSTDRYQGIADLPASIPVFPLGGVLLLPRCQLPLNIFEPRYLQMVDDTLRGGRIIGLVQPDDRANPLGDDKPALMRVGCAGRLTSYTETLDGRTLITLTGIARFRVEAELETTTPYRQCTVDWSEFTDDLTPEFGAESVSRERLLDILKQYLDTHGLQADWRTIKVSTNETLVNSLSLISPYGPREKQALLEAKTLEDRNQMLIALTEVALQQISPSETTVQ
ncbi:MAG: LON peptidase substrate-binding domain-containing protein [Parvibaculum sp.]|uniref:LON peptidase substrate-binding domain-containing protein n=1 Tax=Parvibaculum sp. TaxID=2024848 RepID=UPI0025E27905|nr:LON peptidase substrate-binding domain-containing protein [Parvibaculum sp.]MCE9648025.1 LON peptidase substrate-binding domain-containing protein [Parvibaculum sp.]